MNNGDVIKLRTKKCYKDAANHVIVGNVVMANDIYVQMTCKTYHYKGTFVDSDRVVEGTIETRVIPWSNVECINVLDESFNWRNAVIVKRKDGLYLSPPIENWNEDDYVYMVLLCRSKTTH